MSREQERCLTKECGTGNGLYWIGGTGLALGALAAGKAPEVWSHVDAVLTLGAREHPRSAAYTNPMRLHLALFEIL